jgi:hypothetical protein
MAVPILITGYDIVDSNGDRVQPREVAVQATADGDNTVIASVAGKRIQVTGYLLMVTAAGLVTCKDGAGTVLSKWPCAANGGAAYPGNPIVPAFRTAPGQALVINNPAGVDTYGHISYLLE